MDKYFLIILVASLVILIIFLFYLLTRRRKLKNTNDYKKIDLVTLKNYLETKNNIVLLDVRTKEEHENFSIPNSILIESVYIKRDVETTIPDKNTPIVVYCSSGGRSRATALTLFFLGYKNVYDFGSINNWKDY